MNANDRDVASVAVVPANLALAHGPNALAPLSLDLDDDAPQHRLPSDHPRWNRDAITVSKRARAMFAQLKPVAIRVVQFWEHRVRSISIGHRTLSVDASGSYRLR